MELDRELVSWKLLSKALNDRITDGDIVRISDRETKLDYSAIVVIDKKGNIGFSNMKAIPIVCEYCTNKKKIRDKDVTYYNNYDGMHLDENILVIEGDVGGHDGNYYFEERYKINYCPMCGKKLIKDKPLIINKSRL